MAEQQEANSPEGGENQPQGEDFVTKIKAKLCTLWNGDEPLFKTFWLYYFAAVFVLQLLAAVIHGGFFGLLALLWAGFMVMPIWRAADKYSGEKIWAIIAKVLAVLIGLGVLAGLLT